MKKIKVLASLISAGTIIAATPVVATACTSYDNKLKIKLDKLSFPASDDEALNVTLSYDNDVSAVKKINSITSSDESLLKINSYEVTDYGYVTIYVSGEREGNVKLTINLTDKANHTNQVNYDITITKPLINLKIDKISDVTYDKENNTLYIESIAGAYFNVILSYKGSKKSTRYEIYDVSSSESKHVPIIKARVYYGGFFNLEDDVLPDVMNAPLQWEIRTDDAASLPLKVAFRYYIICEKQTTIPLISASAKEDVEIGRLRVYSRNKPFPIPVPNIEFSVWDFDPKTSGLIRKAFSFSNGSDLSEIVVKFNATTQTENLIPTENVVLTIRWYHFPPEIFVTKLKVNVIA